ncbi:MAG: hypothetical protein ACE5ES_04755, partial [Candidatus Nanoarchaeia archaeon]
KIIMFNPYLVTENFGKNSVSKITIRQLFEKLSSSKTFMKTKQAIVNIDSYHLEQEGISQKELIKLAEDFRLKEKLVLHDKDLLPFGVVRVTFDGKVLTPSQSINPKRYLKSLNISDFNNLNEAWNELIKKI